MCIRDSELMAACGFASSASVAHQLDQLERAGAIARDRRIARGITLPAAGRRPAAGLVGVPVVGTIAAGAPLPVVPEGLGGELAEAVAVSLPRAHGGADDLFALRVAGHSMVDALVADGDIVVLRRAATAADGEVAAVWLAAEGETTLKRVYREPDGRIRLQPANTTMPPRYHAAENVRVQGVLVGVLRAVA